MKIHDLIEAYGILGLAPGAPLAECLRRYKELVMIWHPDRHARYSRMYDEATRRLKQINNARDLLKSHFKGGDHRQCGSCSCRVEEVPKEDASARGATGTGSQQSQSATAPGAKPQTAKNTPPPSPPPPPPPPPVPPTNPFTNHPTPQSGKSNANLRWRCAFFVAVAIVVVYTIALIIKDLRPASATAATTSTPYLVAPRTSPTADSYNPPKCSIFLDRSPFPGENPSSP